MRGIVIDPNSGGPVIAEVPRPDIKENEVLVSVRAASLNRADLWQKIGTYPLPNGVSSVLGLDFSGEIIAIGSEVKHRKVGQKIMGLVEAGGQAEFVAVHEGLTFPMLDHFSFEEAAAIPEVFITAYQALKWLGKLEAGQKVLIHGGASGIGTACIQLARLLGATPFVTAGSHDKRAFCLELGAEEAINYHEEEFGKRILERTEGKGVDLIIDMVGASFFQQNIQALTKGGTIVLLSLLSGTILDKFDLSQLLGKWAHIIGTTLRFRSLDYKLKLVEEFRTFSLPYFASERLKPIIHAVLPWQEIVRAHSLLEKNLATGKVILKIT